MQLGCGCPLMGDPHVGQSRGYVANNFKLCDRVDWVCVPALADSNGRTARRMDPARGGITRHGG